MSRLLLHFMASPVSAKRFVEPLVTALRNNGFRAEICTERDDISDAFLLNINGPLNLLRFNAVANPFRTLSGLVESIRLLRSREPDGVHAHQTRSSFIPLLAAVLTGVRVRIYHNHGSAFWGTSGVVQAIFWCLEYLNCALATHVLFVNPALQRTFVSARIVRSEKTYVAGPGSACGLDFSEYPAELFTTHSRKAQRRALGLAEDGFVALYVGRPFKRKGFHFLLHAWSRFVAGNPGCHLVLAGCSAADVKSVLSDESATISALGYVLDLRPVYASADVIVLPSEHEGFPYALFEASACRRCIVGTDIPGSAAMLVPDKTGLVFRDAESFVDVLTRLRHDEALRESLAANARLHAEQFGREIVLNHLISFYGSVFGSPDTSSGSRRVGAGSP
jgi:glycosyltransferase involved in cell wall biosynthesis